MTAEGKTWSYPLVGSYGGRVFTSFCLCVCFYARYLKKLLQLPAKITKLDVEMFQDKSWKPIYFCVKKSKVEVTSHKKQCRHGSLHSCECWLFLVVWLLLWLGDVTQVTVGLSRRPPAWLLRLSSCFVESSHSTRILNTTTLVFFSFCFIFITRQRRTAVQSAILIWQFHLSVRPSICLSVTRWYCITTTEPIINESAPCWSLGGSVV